MKHILTAFFILSLLSANAQSDSAKKLYITPLPIVLYDPFTGLGYGALANANFKLGSSPGDTRFSNAQAYILYTTKSQLAIQLNHVLFTSHENWMIQGKLQYLDFPEYIYGIGAGTGDKPPVKELVSYKAIEAEERIMKRIGKKNFIGPQLRLYDCRDLSSDIPPGESFFDSAATGNRSFRAAGIGLHFIHDSRDNVQNAYTGRYFEAALNPYLKALSSTQDWVNMRLDYRQYFLLNKNEQHAKVLAVRGMYEQAFGDVPYMIMPMTGRNFTTRGYVQGRYRGRKFATAEAEYRAHIWKALGYVVFGGVQTVSETDGAIRHVKPSAGAGIRIMLNKKQRTNLRIDYALGTDNNSGLYFQVTEVF